MSRMKKGRPVVCLAIALTTVWAIISIAQPSTNDIESKVGGGCDDWCYLSPRSYIECSHDTNYGECLDWMCNIINCLAVGCETQEESGACDVTIDIEAYKYNVVARRIGPGNCVPDDPSGGMKPTVCDCWPACKFGPRAVGRCFHNGCVGELLADFYSNLEGEPGNWVCNNPE
jgi:hypothetical protein